MRCKGKPFELFSFGTLGKVRARKRSFICYDGRMDNRSKHYGPSFIVTFVLSLELGFLTVLGLTTPGLTCVLMGIFLCLVLCSVVFSFLLQLGILNVKPIQICGTKAHFDVKQAFAYSRNEGRRGETCRKIVPLGIPPHKKAVKSEPISALLF